MRVLSTCLRYVAVSTTVNLQWVVNYSYSQILQIGFLFMLPFTWLNPNWEDDNYGILWSVWLEFYNHFSTFLWQNVRVFHSNLANLFGALLRICIRLLWMPNSNVLSPKSGKGGCQSWVRQTITHWARGSYRLTLSHLSLVCLLC